VKNRVRNVWGEMGSVLTPLSRASNPLPSKKYILNHVRKRAEPHDARFLHRRMRYLHRRVLNGNVSVPYPSYCLATTDIVRIFISLR
jgi:hypothetical protein